jgi:hypothetical protein
MKQTKEEKARLKSNIKTAGRIIKLCEENKGLKIQLAKKKVEISNILRNFELQGQIVKSMGFKSLRELSDELKGLKRQISNSVPKKNIRAFINKKCKLCRKRLLKEDSVPHPANCGICEVNVLKEVRDCIMKDKDCIMKFNVGKPMGMSQAAENIAKLNSVKPCHNSKFLEINCLETEEEYGFFKDNNDIRPSSCTWVKKKDVLVLHSLFKDEFIKMINETREALAELEHEQWRHWRKNLEESNPEIRRAALLEVKYNDLLEGHKDEDRVWADKVIALLISREEKI